MARTSARLGSGSQTFCKIVNSKIAGSGGWNAGRARGTDIKQLLDEAAKLIGSEADKADDVRAPARWSISSGRRHPPGSQPGTYGIAAKTQPSVAGSDADPGVLPAHPSARTLSHAEMRESGDASAGLVRSAVLMMSASCRTRSQPGRIARPSLRGRACGDRPPQSRLARGRGRLPRRGPGPAAAGKRAPCS